MSTVSDVAPAPMPLPSTTPAQRFTRLVYVEMRKLVNTRASLWVILTFAILGLLISTLGVHMGKGPVKFVAAFSISQILMSLAIPIVTVLGVTADWQHRVTTSYFPTVQRRNDIAAAKLVASLFTGAALYLSLALVSLLLVLVYGVVLGRGVSWEGIGLTSASVGVSLVFGVLFGYGIGLLVRKFALAMVIVVVASVGSLVVTAFVPEALQPFTTSGTPIVYLLTPFLPQDGSEPLALYQAWGSFLIWYVAPILVGMRLANRAEA